ncbi:Nucleoside 2-deoxyribosyltransferase [Rhodovastum atsumiense]|uniref:Nucleoside 2-deoxyribosyltransferase n=1 Tax=Rhodovastum atsumiense TaxID=504468 RepID=A0A5M6IUN4_9PROT|nr:nucleoside 2-deoxyribosyltransferase [Rhodovastum atsumiense]KAA5611268.1 nucleoside 2-deoxyribosyltransferase [Rhodovastum atsumiense]CAH2601728.1 Nucleoside 2-deoxyribosyltransferase [Rhodovastum atsumiense]
MRVYLAGPDVFMPDPLDRAAALKAVCRRHGLTGVSPLDALADEPSDWAALAEARRIALRNEAHIRSCVALIANLTPFRGPSADAGTVFEVGFMRALGRPVFGWSNDPRLFADRTQAFLNGFARCTEAGWRDGEDMLLEDFALRDNLMIDGAVLASGGALFVADPPAQGRWSDLSAFEACVAALATALGQRG